MKRWVITGTVNPPSHTVSGRYGGSILFVAYLPTLAQWYWVTGSTLERVSEPPMIFVDEEWARANRNLSRKKFNPVKNSLAIRKKKSDQLEFF